MQTGLTGTHYIILCVMAFIPLAVTVLAFPFLPDPMPVHFNIHLQADRWGSRYEAFLLPVITVIIGLFLVWATKFSEKHDGPMGRLMFYVTAGSLILFIAIIAVLTYTYITY